MQNFLNSHKKLGACILFIALCAGSVSAAQAEEVGTGVLIVRGGAANTSVNYDKEDQDSNGRLQGVSVLCASKGSQTAAALVATDTTRVWGAYMSGTTTTVVNKGGHVIKDRQPGNPNHCLINGLTLGQIKGLWH
ncbi:hypothetical protein [Pseudomonas leptonychotis]|uniref:Uncharacterized protein n=1 Tax=Pseudomonas leptonychotis TaxID=2448482 RepID=A0A4V4R8G8_9PSED|nr:hypothetical protein [Pseudomonas leptonychotis]TIH10414.1 hypothetical protein D8779_06965 [Pseudomonas leptonychotis]